MPTIAIIDYGAGNLRSIHKALQWVAARPLPPPPVAKGAGGEVGVTVTADPAVVAAADAVVLPGVGAAGATMRRLADCGLIDPLRTAATDGRPFLGVCLGLQLLFADLEEDNVAGLAVLPGRARRLPGGVKVPHMGWNTVQMRHAGRRQEGSRGIFAGVEELPHFYFVHSYYVEPAAEAAGAVVGVTTYGLEFCSVLVQGPLWATQFHPEKSGAAGLRLLANFVAQVNGQG